MDTTKDKPEKMPAKADPEPQKKTGNNDNADLEQTPLKAADSDMEPDEFIGSNADTDLPLDRQVINDAVLRGEPKADDKALKGPPEDKK
ncbi:hypothetical protein [Longitalea arenae]|uniref:hypothetical protein n=1 Tax=Longitalea arenae TaxID=2812558 RepID=UPI001966FACF|nr:hypothetical protein [Longitalea arenae]